MPEAPTPPDHDRAAAQLITHLQRVTQALAAVRTQDGVFGLILQDALEALGGISGAVLLVKDAALHVAARHGQDDASVWQGGDLTGHRPSPDALRTNTPLFFSRYGDLTAAYPDLEARTGGVAAVANAVLPMVENGRPLGVIVLDFREPHDFTPHEQHFLLTLAAQCALALDRAEATRKLEAQFEERTRQLEEERAALEAFSRFTEAVGHQTDVQALVRQAITLLHETCGVEAAYFEREGEVFRATLWSPSADPALLLLLQRGFPLQHSSIAKGLRQNTAAFIDRWNETGLLIEESGIYQAVAGYPYFVGGELGSVLMIGSRAPATWAERDKGIFRAVGRSLDLALERARVAKHLEEQNAELYVQTLTLEGVAELTRDLSLPGGVPQLIGQVMELVLSLLPSGYASYWETANGLWRLTAHRGDVGRPEWQASRERGFPVGQFPTLNQPWQTGQPYYQGRYNPVQDTAPELTDHLISVATLPVKVWGKAVGVFGVGLFGHRQWSAADRALLETAVQSLGLALERAEQARELTAQRDMLQASNEELEAFTYSVSHDLRTPVRHIISFGSLLRRSLPQPLSEKAARYFTVIEEAALHLNKLIDGMLELSRASRQVLAPERVDLARLTEIVRQEVMAGSARQVSWRVEKLPFVTGDAGLLRQVVAALLGNAVKYTKTRDQARIEVWAEDRGQSWAVFVRDNGVGFDPRYQDKLFSLFQRLHRQEDFEGAGVSLANARRIVARHGGLMSAEGQVGQGATFGFTLPKSGG